MTFRCLECNYRAVDKTGIINHSKDYHNEIEDEHSISYVCIECGKMYDEEVSYQRHMNITHEQSCMECDRVFTQSLDLKLHMD